MKTSNIFNIQRFGFFMRQNLIHHYKMILFSLAGFCGAVFIILLIGQMSNDFRPLTSENVLGIFLFLFFVLGVIFAGTAFPGLRSKEKSFNFLLVPVSTFEKFLFEFLNRIAFFIVAMPLVFWLIFIIEGYFAQLIIPGFRFETAAFYDSRMFDSLPNEIAVWVYVLITSGVLLSFIVPFTGATIFMKHPLLKTIFSLAVVFFFHLFLVLLFVKVFNMNEYEPANDSILFIKSAKGGIRFFAIYSMVINIGLIAAAYFKLKEREV